MNNEIHIFACYTFLFYSHGGLIKLRMLAVYLVNAKSVGRNPWMVNSEADVLRHPQTRSAEAVLRDL